MVQDAAKVYVCVCMYVYPELCLCLTHTHIHTQFYSFMCRLLKITINIADVPEAKSVAE